MNKQERARAGIGALLLENPAPTWGDVVPALDHEQLDALGIDPWCVHEGLVNGSEPFPVAEMLARLHPTNEPERQNT